MKQKGFYSIVVFALAVLCILFFESHTVYADEQDVKLINDYWNKYDKYILDNDHNYQRFCCLTTDIHYDSEEELLKYPSAIIVTITDDNHLIVCNSPVSEDFPMKRNMDANYRMNVFKTEYSKGKHSVDVYSCDPYTEIIDIPMSSSNKYEFEIEFTSVIQIYCKVEKENGNSKQMHFVSRDIISGRANHTTFDKYNCYEGSGELGDNTKLWKMTFKNYEKYRKVGECINKSHASKGVKALLILSYALSFPYDYDLIDNGRYYTEKNATKDDKARAYYKMLYNSSPDKHLCTESSFLVDMLCEICDIKCDEIMSNDHMWNLIELDGEWMCADATQGKKVEYTLDTKQNEIVIHPSSVLIHNYY